MSYLKILSCKHYNQNDPITVYSNGFFVGNVVDKIDTKILVELKTLASSVDFLYNTIQNSTDLYNGVAGDFRIDDAKFNSEISGEQTSFSGNVAVNQGSNIVLQKNAPISGFSDYADAQIVFKYETPTILSTAAWSNLTSYLEGQYSVEGSKLYVALQDNTDQDPTATVEFWAEVQEETFIYEITHKWTVRPYLPESDTSGANTVQPAEFAGSNAIKYIFRIEFKGAVYLTEPDRSTERLINGYDVNISYSIDDYKVYNGLIYRSLQDANSGNQPSAANSFFWVLDESPDLNNYMQPSNAGFYDEKYDAGAAKYTLVNVTTPTGSNVDNSNDISYSFQIKNNEGDFTTDTKLRIHSLLERDGSDFDSQLSADSNSSYASLQIPVDGTTTQNIGGTISNAKAEINGTDPTLADISFIISSGSYDDRFGVFVTPVQNSVITLPPECGARQSSGGAGVTTQIYTGNPDGAYSVNYDMNNAPDAMDIFYFDINNPTVEIILDTTGGAVSGTGSLSFNFVAALAAGGAFHIRVDGGFNTGTIWYYTLICPAGTGTSTSQTGFSGHNNIWVSAYDILAVTFDDLNLIGDCPNINFYYHYDDANTRKGVNEFKGFIKDFALAGFELENSNPARTVVNQIQLAIKTVSGNVIESTTILSTSLDFSGTKDVTFTNNAKGQISLTENAGIYVGSYGFTVKSEWLQYTDVVFALIVKSTIVKTNSSESEIKEFKSSVFDLGGFDQTKNTAAEPIMARHDGSVQYWDVTETTQYAAPLNVGLTRIIGVFKEINLGDTQTNLADFTGFLFANESGQIPQTQYIHDRANVLQAESPFTPIAPETGALIEVDGIDPTIVYIKSDYDAAKASALGFDCIDIGARLDRTDANPPPNVIEIKDTDPAKTDAKENDPLDYATYIISRITGGTGEVTMDIIVNGTPINPITPATDVTLEYLNTNGTWYILNTGFVTIPSGETEVNIRLQVAATATVSGIENFEIVISNADNNTTIQTDTVNGTITEDLSETVLYSLHFAGEHEGNNQVVKLFNKATNLQVHDVLGMATTYEIKYKDTHGVVDWSLEPVRNLAEIQSDIDAGSSTYSLYFEITSYATTYLNAVLCLEYITEEVATATFQYQSNNILAQNIWIGVPAPYQLNIDSIASVNASASTFHFGLKTANTDDMTLYNENLAGINGLLSGNVADKVVAIYIEYGDPNIDDTFTLGTTITG